MAKTTLELPVKLQKELLDYIAKHSIPKERQDRILAAVKEAYASALYDPEEPVGVVTAQSLSEPMTQMSLDASERIIVKHNGRIGIAPIGAFTDQLLERFGSAQQDGWDICDLSSYELLVPALQPDEKVAWRRVLACSRHNAPEKLLRIRTRSGRTITATASHSFVTRKANRIVPVAGSALRP
ncbi:MAG TPA: intein-containing DNA-directed RNA polymerase subunit A'', partial [archaeon]|nr:intein-containing DNA-directed RNA polymerase subunit A'' [archaeon]